MTRPTCSTSQEAAPVRQADVLRPFPTRLVTGAADRHRPDLHHFEVSLFERPHFIGLLETLDQEVVVTRNDPLS